MCIKGYRQTLFIHNEHPIPIYHCHGQAVRSRKQYLDEDSRGSH